MNRKIKKKLDEIIRVNHAGEFGAKRIYSAQIKFTKKKILKEKLIEMLEEEKAHFDYFDKEMVKSRARPTVMRPIWNFGGYCLGALTCIMGEKYIHTCTEAVEEVIVEHYKSQIKYLDEKKISKNLLVKLKKFCQEEDEHRKVAQGLVKDNDLKLDVFRNFTKGLTKIAIEISKKV